MSTNQERAVSAEQALEVFMSSEYGDGLEVDEAIPDLITNLLHLAAVRGFEPAELLRRAEMNYTAERGPSKDELKAELRKARGTQDRLATEVRTRSHYSSGQRMTAPEIARKRQELQTVEQRIEDLQKLLAATTPALVKQ